MMNKGEATAAKKIYDNKVTAWAELTPGWAIKHGCFRDAETKEIDEFFVIERGPKTPPGKKCWCEWSGESVDVWKAVADAMFKQGIDLCALAFKGHYIGLPGERGLKFGSGINQAITRLMTAVRLIEYTVLLGDWAEVEPFVDQRLQGDVEVKKLLRLMRNIRRLVNGMGRPTTISMAEFMLEATMEVEDDESDSE